ncbi:hypothetical protein [Streptomyces sp. SAJ15]|uniref:hypothetical protein n=1 Tax=Streptomyces sp. SAJ15 TaxID=2011095 RepID=UPI001184C910|nr:hypothetical protein [Streptomyces sp. SAJ15]TVL89801.1 hypothetical protein CD790_25735 [Streptomyces sp. SAJ15]
MTNTTQDNPDTSQDSVSTSTQTGQTAQVSGGGQPDSRTNRGYCPACGRGDCSPTADQWHAERQRALRAEAALARGHCLLDGVKAEFDGDSEADEEVRLVVARIRAAIDTRTASEPTGQITTDQPAHRILVDRLDDERTKALRNATLSRNEDVRRINEGMAAGFQIAAMLTLSTFESPEAATEHMRQQLTTAPAAGSNSEAPRRGVINPPDSDEEKTGSDYSIAAGPAAAWWAERLRESHPYVGDHGLEVVFHDKLIRRNRASADQLARFEAELARLITAAKYRPPVRVKADWHAEGLLAQAGQHAGIDDALFPRKTHMMIWPDHILIKPGRTAAWSLRWAAPDWQHPPCAATEMIGDDGEGPPCSSPRWHEGRHEWETA